MVLRCCCSMLHVPALRCLALARARSVRCMCLQRQQQGLRSMRLDADTERKADIQIASLLLLCNMPAGA